MQLSKFPEQFSDETLSLLLDSVANGIIVTDHNGKILWVNKAFTIITGYSFNEAIGKNPRILKSEYHDDSFYQDTWNTISNGEIWHKDFINKRKNNTHYFQETTITPVKNRKITHYIAVIQDVTSKKHADRELRNSEELFRTLFCSIKEAYNDLEEAYNDLEDFTYIASHDLKEPLRKIKAFSELLTQSIGNTNETCKMYLNYLNQSSSQMITLINDLLKFSKTSRKEIFKEELLIEKCVKDAIDTLDQEIKNKKAIIKINLPEKKSIRTYGDKTLIMLVFQNLISNALKFNNNKNPIVEITCRKENDQTIFIVKDNGIGIEEEYKEQIFNPLKRLCSHDEYPGSGIGLSICKKIINKHNGKIWVESQVNKGSCFKFTLEECTGD